MSNGGAVSSGGAQPTVIPYSGDAVGPRRRLDLTLQRSPIVRRIPPTVAIDGRSYLVQWGQVAFEVPADRPVHVAVWVEYQRQVGAASVLLAPEMPPTLEYAAPAQFAFAGQLGAPGTVRRKGGVYLGCMLAMLIGALLLLLLVVVLIVSAVVRN